ncbi:MAG: dicarboxylate/amino acid:cation symporter [Spirochaetaceae bacterium]|jgi:Na+/H+-dicarboxylate symporter|nr:dicarboxylate/amino acid:cation symporter [Spirochaetaceae bacterium]
MKEKNAAKKWYSWYFEFNLLYRILIGLVLGVVLGLVLKEKILWIQPLGDLFVRLLKMIMMPIILSTLIVGASSVSPANLGKVGLRVIVLYLLTSAAAVLLGLGMGAVFRPSAELTGAAEAAGKAAQAPKLSQTLLNIVPTSIMQVIVNETILAVIFVALLVGLGISYLRVSGDERKEKAAATLYNFFDGIAEVMMLIIKGIMQYAPIGVLSLVSVVFATNGPKVVGSLGVVTLACFVGYALHIIIVYLGLVKFYAKLPIGRYFRDAKDPFITAFVTRSSNGTLPVTMEAAESLGVPKDIYSFSLPLGATINMDGTAIYQGVCATFIALSVWGHGFSLSQMGLIIVTATLASIGTAGVPGAGAIMLLLVLDSVGLKVEAGSLVAGAYAMILGIDALLDMGRTALNVSGDLAVTTIVARRMKELDQSKWNEGDI